MSSLSALGSTACAGVQRAAASADRAAAEVTARASGDRFTASDASDVAGSMLDLGVAKYAFVASLAVLRTADEVSRDLTRLVG